MSERAIIREPNAILHEIAKDIPPADIASPRIRKLIADMKATLASAADGVGLAAPQVNVSLKIFLVSEEADSIDELQKKKKKGEEVQQDASVNKRAWKHFVFINGEFKKQSRKKDVMNEGCLSIPGKFGEVHRSEKIELSWLDENGKKHTRGFTGFFARVIQHEMDHLAGALISDRAKRMTDVNELALKHSSGS